MQKTIFFSVLCFFFCPDTFNLFLRLPGTTLSREKGLLFQGTRYLNTMQAIVRTHFHSTLKALIIEIYPKNYWRYVDAIWQENE
jgi:hypothetical protein